jgi:type III secretory pathway component EscU
MKRAVRSIVSIVAVAALWWAYGAIDAVFLHGITGVGAIVCGVLAYGTVLAVEAVNVRRHAT